MKVKAILSFFLCISIMYNNSIFVYANGSKEMVENEKEYIWSNGENIDCTNDYDEVLAEAGTPSYVINGFSEEQKKFIVENLGDNPEFESFDVYELGGKLESLSRASVISSSEMSVTVACYKITVSGNEKRAEIFPTFKWTDEKKIYNDTFSVAVYPGWEIVPDTTAKVRVYMKEELSDNEMKTIDTKDFYPIDASEKGYSFGFAADCCKKKYIYEGYGLFYAKKKDDNATNALTVGYVHDSSTGLNISYGVTIGWASIGFDFNGSDNLETYSKNLNFNYK